MWGVINICFLCNVKRFKDIVALYWNSHSIKHKRQLSQRRKMLISIRVILLKKHHFKILQIRFYNRPKDNTEYLVLSEYLIQFIQF